MDGLDILQLLAVLSIIIVPLGMLIWYVTLNDRTERRVREYIEPLGGQVVEVSQDNSDTRQRMFFITYRDSRGQVHKAMAKIRDVSSVEGIYWLSEDPRNVLKANPLSAPLDQSAPVDQRAPLGVVEQLQTEIAALKLEIAQLKQNQPYR